jgi:hypothetical protein
MAVKEVSLARRLLLGLRSQMKPNRSIGILLFFTAAVWSNGLGSVRSSPNTGSVELQMKNVKFRVAQDIVLEVDRLRGRLRRTHPEVPVTFDDTGSFVVEIDSAQVGITAESMTALMNSYVLADKSTPLKGVSLTIAGDKLILKGTIHKTVPLAFEIEGSVSATNEGNIRVHAKSIKADHVPVKGLLHLFGEDLSKVIKQNSERGMKMEGDDIILTPAALTPPPHLEGRVAGVEVTQGKMVQTFDSGHRSPALSPPSPAAAYIYHRGGILRFGKLTMNDADLEIVGDRPGSFDFFQREYQKQLIAGYSKNTPANGLVAHMADYSHFATRASQASGNQARANQAVGK